MAKSKELKALITLAGKVDPSLQSALNKAAGGTKNLSESLKESSRHSGSLGQAIKASFIGNLAAKEVSKLITKVADFSKEGLNLASDLKEVQNVVDKTFKESSGQIDSWSKTALKAYGLAELQAKQYSGTMGAMLKSSGINEKDIFTMSTSLAGLAGDYASFYNLDHDQAWEKIRSGISGETEPLKQLGINMSVANLQNYALSKGIKVAYSDMDQASQTLLRYSYLMEVSKDVQGDFASTSGEYANQQRLFNTTLKQTAATLSGEMLPYFTKWYQKGNEFLSNADIAGAADRIGKAFELMGKGIKYVSDNGDIIIPILWGVAAAMGTYELATWGVVLAQKKALIITALTKAYGVAQMSLLLLQSGTSVMTLVQMGLNAAFMACPIGWIAAGIGLLVAGGIMLYKNWDSVKAKGFELWDGLKSAFGSGVNWVVDKLNWLITKINHIPGIEIPLIPKVGGNSKEIALSGLNQYARGGIATEASIFGEAGPEMAIPLERTPRSLGLLNKTAQILGIKSESGESKAIHFTYSPVIYGGNREEIEPILKQHKDDVRSILEEILEEKRMIQFGYE